MPTNRNKLLAEEILDFDARFQAIAAGTNKEDDSESLLDDLRISAVELSQRVIASKENND
jgi:hypothetical protein